MARSFRQSVVVTVAVVAGGGLMACSGVRSLVDGAGGGDEPLIGNPPMPVEAKVSFPKAPFTEGQSLEARDGEGRTIGHADGKCWVELPFDEPPTSWRPPPTQAVDCPTAVLDDPAYAACNGGSVHLKSLGPPLDCVCYFSGNPPPPPQDVQCPVVAIPELATAVAPPAIGRNPPAVPPHLQGKE